MAALQEVHGRLVLAGALRGAARRSLGGGRRGDRRIAAAAHGQGRLARELDRARRRCRRAAPVAPGLRARRRRGRALDDDLREPGLLPGDEADPQQPARVEGRRWAAGPGRARDLRGRAGRGRRPSSSSSSSPATSSTSTTRSRPVSCPHVVAADVKVIWRCHIGVDRPGELAHGAWDFLRPLRRRRRRLRLLAGAVRLGGARQGPGLDRPAVDRRLLAEEPGPRCRGGGAPSSTVIGAAGVRRRGSRALPPFRRQRGPRHPPRAT